MASETQSMPERPKEPEADGAADEGGSTEPSKKALKKAAKEKEKAEKAAKRAEEERQRKAQADANDVSKDSYGKLPDGLSKATLTPLGTLSTEHVGKSVTFQTYVQNARAQSAKLAFLELRSGTKSIQAVIAESQDPPLSRQMVKFCGSMPKESIVEITGKVVEPLEPVLSASISNLELHITGCFVVAQAPIQLPIQYKDSMTAPPLGEESAEKADSTGTPALSLLARLDNRVLDLRSTLNRSIFQINAAIESLFSQYLEEKDFMRVFTPKMLGAATEGGAGVFEVKYFKEEGKDRTAYLSQSPQFYKQMLISAAFERVLETGPVFRAENSNTARHLTEFTGLDFEMRIYQRWDEVIDMAEDLLIYVFRGLRERKRCQEAMEIIQTAYPDAGNFLIPEGKAPRIVFADGIKMLKDAGIEASAEEDISTTNEKTLGKLVREKYKTDFYFLTHYPAAARPFYTHLDPANPKVTLSYDAFMRGQEICSGAQRIHDPEMLFERMKSMDPPINPEDPGFKYYIEAFKVGCPPHGGGGLGLNRMTMLWLGLPNIRQATLFPRDPQRLAP